MRVDYTVSGQGRGDNKDSEKTDLNQCSTELAAVHWLAGRVNVKHYIAIITLRS